MRACIAMLFLFLFASGSAWAAGCPGKIAQIDAALASGEHAELTEEALAEVRALRAHGERQHSGGDHGDAMESLGRAMEKLEIAD